MKQIFKYLILLILLLFSTPSYARSVTLSWDANSETDLRNYVVYWGTSSGTYTSNSGSIGLVTEYSVEIPDDDQIYYFAVTAVNTSDLESDYSNEVHTDSPDPDPDPDPDVPIIPGTLNGLSLEVLE